MMTIQGEQWHFIHGIIEDYSINSKRAIIVTTSLCSLSRLNLKDNTENKKFMSNDEEGITWLSTIYIVDTFIVGIIAKLELLYFTLFFLNNFFILHFISHH